MNIMITILGIFCIVIGLVVIINVPEITSCDKIQVQYDQDVCNNAVIEVHLSKIFPNVIGVVMIVCGLLDKEPTERQTLREDKQ